jgi:4-amino-4-deoxychorismate lyase
MSRLFETIKCSEGKLFNMEFHQSRFEKACREFFGFSTHINLIESIEIPEFAKTGLFRCRVTYSKQIDKIEFIPHQYREIKSLKLIEDNEIDYRFKFDDRERLNRLFEQRGTCDDIIIVKNGLITDSSYANIIFYDERKWWTPDSPLLPGTQRAKLLSEKKISACRITYKDISKYKKAGLINALNNMEEMPEIEIANILD